MGHRLVAGILALGVSSALMSGPAVADPSNAKNSFATELTCDNGRTYQVVVNGNGEFTPAHDTASNAVLIPVSFGPFTGTIRDNNGDVVETFTEPGSSKGQSAKGVKNPVTCTFNFTETSDGSDPDFPAGYTFTGSGSVVVKITPQRR